MRKVDLKKGNFKGFTLIELLVVIVVIGILATIAMVSFMASQGQTRDANRKSDINQYKAVLAQYASKNKGYYPVSGATNLQVLCENPSELDHQNCPDDPTDGVNYMYVSNASGSQYAIWAQMESTDDFWISCSTGQTGKGETPSVDGSCTVGTTDGGGGEVCDDEACQAGCVEQGTEPGSCVAGSCECTGGGGTEACNPGETECPAGSGSCVDTTTDIVNCGGCGIACEASQTCLNSNCVPSCSETDGGNVPLTFGVVTIYQSDGAIAVREDSCYTATRVQEVWCVSPTSQSLASVTHDCPSLIQNGVCSAGRCVDGMTL